MKRQQVLSVDYFDKFECIGNKCEDHCCKNWSITIDKKHILNIKNYKNQNLEKSY